MTTDLDLTDVGEILANDRGKTADSIWAIYVRPDGDTGDHFIKIQEDGPLIRVGSAVPGVTFRPKTRVPVLRPEGRSPMVIVGFPPPGKKGTALPPSRRRITPDPVASDPYEFMAVFISESAITAALYTEEGLFDSNIGTASGSFGSWQPPSRISVDTESLVSDNSIVLVGGDPRQKVFVFDPVTSTVYTATTTGIWRTAPMAGYEAGWVYWGNAEDDTDAFDVELRRARADLTSESLIGSATLPDNSDTLSLGWGSSTGVVLSQGKFVMGFAKDFVGSPEYMSAQFSLAGSSATSAVNYDNVYAAMSYDVAKGLGFHLTDSDQLLSVDDAVAVQSTVWPSSSLWRLGSLEPRSTDLSNDGSDALLYGGDLSTNVVIVGPSTGASGTDPTVRVTLEAHPTLGQPDAVFFYEAG